MRERRERERKLIFRFSSRFFFSCVCILSCAAIFRRRSTAHPCAMHARRLRTTREEERDWRREQQERYGRLCQPRLHREEEALRDSLACSCVCVCVCVRAYVCVCVFDSSGTRIEKQKKKKHAVARSLVVVRRHQRHAPTSPLSEAKEPHSAGKTATRHQKEDCPRRPLGRRRVDRKRGGGGRSGRSGSAGRLQSAASN